MAEMRESNQGNLYKCVGCGSFEVIMPNNPKTDGRSCKQCGEHMNFYGFAGIDYASSNSKSIGKLHIDVEVSEALKGLKAVTREAKKATEALKELEDQQKKIKVDWYELGGKPAHIDAGIVIDGINDKLTVAVKKDRARRE